MTEAASYVVDDTAWSEAERVYKAMARSPRAIARPTLIVSGYRSQGIVARALAKKLRAVTSQPELIAHASVPTASSYEQAAERVRRVWRERLGDASPIDYVGVSMGGLIGRLLASEAGGSAPIARLFTIASPHRGANLAKLLRPDQAARDMRSGSPRQQSLDAALHDAPYELVCYARKRDWWVGTQHCAPPGRMSVAVRTPMQSCGHLLASKDARIIADIARRLRGEPPLLIDPERGDGCVVSDPARA